MYALPFFNAATRNTTQTKIKILLFCKIHHSQHFTLNGIYNAKDGNQWKHADPAIQLVKLFPPVSGIVLGLLEPCGWRQSLPRNMSINKHTTQHNKQQDLKPHTQKQWRSPTFYHRIIRLATISQENFDSSSTTKPFLLKGWTKSLEAFMGRKSGTPAPHWSISHYCTNVTSMVHHNTP